MLSDAQARVTALSSDRSFIVQAPAGSGKTGLLVYRILKLLTTVEKPEQVLAITFTRKATSEMRQRLMELLLKAEQQILASVTETNGEANGGANGESNEFEQLGIDLAKQVLAHSEAHGWQLLDTPNQLQLLTIDAFSAKLTSDMPWLSRLGDQPRTTDQADALYEAAIEQLFQELLAGQSELSTSLQTVLLELDFDYNRARRVFKTMLAKRDHWLRHLLQNDIGELRPQLELAWRQIGQSILQNLHQQFSQATLQRLVEVGRRASELMGDQHSPLAVFRSGDIEAPLNAEQWRGIQFLLLTKDGKGFRARLDKRCGFPPSDKPHKQRMLDILEELREDQGLLTHFQQLSILPNAEYSDADWQQLLALEDVLKNLAAFLQLRFRSKGECDHSEVTQRASLALREMDSPTDLALRIDYQLQHILVDEFQDTSRSQLDLLKYLTAGWQQAGTGGGQTLFMVGDPMQSIYRFREADVGLFLQVANNSQTQIFENIEIEPLQLSENFRSGTTLVDWFNKTFNSSFPADNQVLNGAIKYANAISNKQLGGQIKCRLASSREQEATLVVDAVQSALAQLPDANAQVAVLVRSRTHLKHLLPALRCAGIAYSGVDIQPLQETPAVIDVVSLCRAICRLDDRIVWFALLRGPWCGLTLSEIKQLVDDHSVPVWEQLLTVKAGELEQQSSQQRFIRFRQIMQRTLEQRQQLPLHSVVRWAWQELGGTATLFGAQHQDVEVVFDLIEQLQRDGDLQSFTEFNSALEDLFARPASTESTQLVVSTIHKAKGLQYHTVILPGLSNKARVDEKEVLMWAEHSDTQGRAQLLLAPIRIAEGEGSHYDYLRALEQQRNQNELVRLMYVACTRAESNIVLLGRATLDTKTDQPKPPASSSLLATVWGALHGDFILTDQAGDQSAEHTQTELPQLLSRLPADFSVSYPPAVQWNAEQPRLAAQTDEDTGEQLEYQWATNLANAVGLYLHEWLQYNAANLFSFEVDEAAVQQWRTELKQYGVPNQQLNEGVKRLQTALKTMQANNEAQFIFQPRAEQANEYSVSAIEDGKVMTYRLDRTFVDDAGVRWVVDYKTTYSNTGDIDAFIDQQIEERHKSQLEHYGQLMQKLDSRPIKLAVYFPLFGKMRSWDYTQDK